MATYITCNAGKWVEIPTKGHVSVNLIRNYRHAFSSSNYPILSNPPPVSFSSTRNDRVNFVKAERTDDRES